VGGHDAAADKDDVGNGGSHGREQGNFAAMKDARQ
jgi:hypothetical protein